MGGNDWTFGDVPLDHAPERYRVEILDAGILVRSVDVDTNSWTYSLAQQEADFGGLAGGFAFTVRQLSPVLGPGLLAHGEF